MCCCCIDYVFSWVGVVSYFFFFFNDTATTEIYTLSLHDALLIWRIACCSKPKVRAARAASVATPRPHARSDEHRLNSSHDQISYADFCLKKKKKKKEEEKKKKKKKKKQEKKKTEKKK